mmetsp:Transcript_33231/g.52889  ORF Transcript_33231/g.52889 Transcript_33231/m.52889 type:complete len:303 (+) Transcript_33231:2-910(+)
MALRAQPSFSDVLGSAWAADAAEVQKCPIGSQSSSLKGEPLWECVKSALLALRGSSIIVFDWDDTLFPTTALATSGHLPKIGAQEDVSADHPHSLTDPSVLKELSICLDVAARALKAARTFGNILIVTNSDHGWVHDIAAKFSSILSSELKDIPVISARSIFEPGGIADSRLWKVLCFRRIVACLHEGDAGIWGVRNLVSIGDSLDEREAAMKTAECCPCYVKSIKFAEKPEIAQLTQQLEWCSSCLGQIAYHMGNLDLNLARDSVSKPMEDTILDSISENAYAEPSRKRQRLSSWADRLGA